MAESIRLEVKVLNFYYFLMFLKIWTQFSQKNTLFYFEPTKKYFLTTMFLFKAVIFLSLFDNF